MIAVSNIPSSPTVQIGLCLLWYKGLIQNRHTQVMVELRIYMPVALTLVELMLMFLRRNPSVLFAFVVIWLSHLLSD